MSTVAFSNIQELREFLTSTGAEVPRIERMFSKTSPAGSQVAFCSPFNMSDETPSFVVNLQRGLYYDHSSNSTGKRGGHINQLVLLLGGSTKGVIESDDLLEKYIEFIFAKNKLPNTFLRKPNWNVNFIANNPSVGYDELSNSLVLFTFTQSGKTDTEAVFTLTKHAKRYPLHPGGEWNWFDLLDANALSRGEFQTKISFISHPALEVGLSEANTTVFKLPLERVKRVVATEGEPDAITASMFGEDTLGVSWKNYAMPELSPSTEMHFLSDFGAESLAIERAKFFLSIYDSIKSHDFLGFDTGAEYIVDDLTTELNVENDDEVMLRSRNLRNNFDITNYLELFPGTERNRLTWYLELQGELFSYADRSVLPLSTICDGEQNEQSRHRAHLFSAISDTARENTLSMSDSGVSQARHVEGQAHFLTKSGVVRGYFAGYGQPYAFDALVFPCGHLDDTKCDGCFVFRTRNELAKLQTGLSSIWTAKKTPLSLTLRVLPESSLGTYRKQSSSGSRTNYMRALGVTCGFETMPDIISLHSFNISAEDSRPGREYEDREYRSVKAIPLDLSVTATLGTMKQQQLLEFAGYYANDDKLFVVASITEVAEEDVFPSGYKGRFKESHFSPLVEDLRRCQETEVPSEEVHEVFLKFVKMVGLALGSPNFLDNNFLASVVVSLFSSSFVGERICTLQEVQKDTSILARKATYLGSSMFLLGDVSSGKSETFLRFNSVFENVRSKNYADIKQTMFRPSSMVGGHDVYTSFELAGCNSGLMAIDGLQASGLKRNPHLSAKRYGKHFDSDEVRFVASGQQKLTFDLLDTPLQRGSVSPQGTMAVRNYGDSQTLANAPIVFTGNLKADNADETVETLVLQAFYDFGFAIGGNLDAMTKRIAPIFAKKGTPGGTAPDARTREDAIFILRDTKLFQSQTTVFFGDGDQLLAEARSNAVKNPALQEAIGRRALAIANMFRVLRHSHRLHNDDIRFARKLIEEANGEIFTYCDVVVAKESERMPEAINPDEPEVEVEAQDVLDYNPEGTPFGKFLKALGGEAAREVLKLLFVKVGRGARPMRGLGIDLGEYRTIAEGYGFSANPIEAFKLKESLLYPLTRQITYANNHMRGVPIPHAFYDAIERYTRRLK